MGGLGGLGGQVELRGFPKELGALLFTDLLRMTRKTRSCNKNRGLQITCSRICRWSASLIVVGTNDGGPGGAGRPSRVERVLKGVRSSPLYRPSYNDEENKRLYNNNNNRGLKITCPSPLEPT